MFYSVTSPARFCVERAMFEAVDIIEDIENDRIELISEDKSNVIRLDLIGADALADVLQKVAGSQRFQSALKEKIVEHGSRYNAVDSAAS